MLFYVAWNGLLGVCETCLGRRSLELIFPIADLPCDTAYGQRLLKIRLLIFSCILSWKALSSTFCCVLSPKGLRLSNERGSGRPRPKNAGMLACTRNLSLHTLIHNLTVRFAKWHKRSFARGWHCRSNRERESVVVVRNWRALRGPNACWRRRN